MFRFLKLRNCLGAACAMVVLGALACGRSQQPGTSPATTSAVAPPAPAPSPAGRRPAPDDSTPVLLEVTIDNGYPQGDVSTFSKAVNAFSATSRPADVPAGENVPELIKKEFGFGQTDLPDHYALLRDAIMRLNGLASAGAIDKPTVQVPNLPPWGFARFAAPAIEPMIVNPAAPVTAPRLSDGQPFTPETAVKPRSTVYYVPTTRGALRSGAYKDFPNEVAAFLPISVRLVASPGAIADPGTFLTKDEMQTIPSDLAPGGADVRLYVVDAGWPDDASWRESREALAQLCERVRSLYHFGAGPDLRASGAFPPPTYGPKSHAVAIQAAIAPLRAMSPHVKVVYVPLTLDQGARDVIAELLRLGVAVRAAKGDLKGKPPPAAASLAKSEIGRASQSYIDAALSAIDPAPGTDGGATIDAGLLAGLFSVASEVADLDQGVFFVNESWTTLDDLVQLAPLGLGRGIVIAAVGNENGRNVDDRPVVAFAGLASAQQGIVAVMTEDMAGQPDCHTSVMTYEDPNLGATGYLGHITASDCGSSYAAPRVAWFLAARETIAKGSIPSGKVWTNTVRDRLKRLRAVGHVPEALRFDPHRYLTAP